MVAIEVYACVTCMYSIAALVKMEQEEEQQQQQQKQEPLVHEDENK